MNQYYVQITAYLAKLVTTLTNNLQEGFQQLWDITYYQARLVGCVALFLSLLGTFLLARVGIWGHRYMKKEGLDLDDVVPFAIIYTLVVLVFTLTVVLTLSDAVTMTLNPAYHVILEFKRLSGW